MPVLAAINKIESGFGQNLGPSSAGAYGWMQFMPATWAAYGVDADGDGRRDPADPDDAIHAAARYLRASGAPRDWYRAVFAYNHADWYVREVLAQADQYQGACTLTLDAGPIELGELDFTDTTGAWGGSQKFARRSGGSRPPLRMRLDIREARAQVHELGRDLGPLVRLDRRVRGRHRLALLHDGLPRRGG